MSLKQSNNEIVLTIDDKTIILEKESLLPKSMSYYEQKNDDYIIIHYNFDINVVNNIDA